MQRIKLNAIRFVQILTLVLILGFAWISNTNAADTQAPAPIEIKANETGITEVKIADETSLLFNTIYNEVSPSIVSINVTASNGRFTSSGTGSGFVIDTTGHIVTNNHVVDGATAIEVEFFDGSLVAASIVGVDPDSDLAVLIVDKDASQPIPVEFGDSDSLIIGETVLAIGSPYGQDWTLTTGIVSALNRAIGGLSNFSIGGVIQTDAAINPGNSGGPLLNLNGQVVGVNSQILTDSGSNSGIGFAIPGNLVRRVANELIAEGAVSYSYMGMTGLDINLALIDSLDLPNNTRGVIVTETVRNSPAAQAGLRSANTNAQVEQGNFDIITAVNGISIKGMSDLISYLSASTAPGQTINLQILRAGAAVDVPLTLAPRP